MKRMFLGVALCLALIGCSDKDDTAAGGKAGAGTGDIAAGKALAEKECKGCHGLDGKGVAPGIPHLAGQSDRYILTSLKEYIDKKRSHAALRQIAEHMSEADARNVAAYFASLPPVTPAAGLAVFSPYERGKSLAPAPNVTSRPATARRRERRAWPASSRATSLRRPPNISTARAPLRRCTAWCGT